MKKIGFILIFILALSLVVGCSQDMDNAKDQSVISSFNLQEVVETDGETAIKIELKEDIKDASYHWSAEKGEIEGSGNEVVYLAPADSGRDKITVAIDSNTGAEKIRAEEEIEIAKIVSKEEQSTEEVDVDSANSWFSLDYPEQIIKGESIEFSGRTSSDIAEIEIKVDQYKLDTIEVDWQNRYSLTYSFTHANRGRDLLIRAYNGEGQVVAAVRRKIDVLNSKQSGVDKEAINREIAEIIDGYGLTGMSAAVVKDTGNSLETVFSQGYGLANLETNTAVNDDTVYRIASISKVVTATALMQLVEAGQVDLDSDVSDYLGFRLRNPNYPNNKITLRQILAHNSSIANDPYINFYRDTNSNLTSGQTQPSLEELFNRYDNQAWLNYRPGSRFTYSNLTSAIVATVVENVSGERFDRYCRDNIFQPLGMNNSTFNRGEADRSNFAMMYRGEQRQNYAPGNLSLGSYRAGRNAAIFSPWGGFLTTANDLAKFMKLHMAGKPGVLSFDTVKQMQQQNWSTNQGYRFFVFNEIGLQFQITEDVVPGKKMVGHFGGAYGLLSDMYFAKDGDFGLIFITNGGHRHESFEGQRSPYYQVEEEIFDLLAKYFID